MQQSWSGKAKAIATCAQHTLNRELCIHQPPADQAELEPAIPRRLKVLDGLA
jgi:hypothetical protein